MVSEIQGQTGTWELVIGLEVHAQVTSKSKLFSGAPAGFGAEPNASVSLVDAAMPGMLPVINYTCVEQAVRTGLGLNAQINLTSIFDRKNYFYPDLPQGYQISQFSDPIVGKGEVTLDMPDGTTRTIGITRLHLEQDAGKSVHDQSPTHTFVDLNRAGVALMEIVTEPDIRSSEEAAEFMKKLRSIVRYLGTCDGDMEKGSMRCDANVSVRKPGGEYGTRCEIKNLNSVRHIMKAIEYEATRQVEIIESGGTIDQETRLYDAGTGETRSMRSKEDAQDYRYFPDPDLLPLVLDEAWVARIRETLPELPDQKKTRYMEAYNIPPYDAGVIVADKATSEYFDAVVAHVNPKLATNWITIELFGRLNKAGLSIKESPVSSAQMVELIKLIEDEVISGKIAKQVFDIMFETSKNPSQIVEEQGLQQVTDTSEIEKIIKNVLLNNSEKVQEYRSGKEKLYGFFIGQVMKATGGKANPDAVNKLMKEMLVE